MKGIIKVALVDDHVLFHSGLTALFNQSNNIEVVLVAENGQDMINKLNALKKVSFPDVFIIDVNMPVMNGIETVQWLNKKYPDSKIVMLTMSDKPEIIMKLVKLGVKSYLTKDKSTSDLLMAISLVKENKFYFPDEITGIIVASHQSTNESISKSSNVPYLTEREVEILKLSCTEMTYSEIAKELQLSPRTIDSYRDILFKKLKVKSRAGLVMAAIKLNLITAND